jgi:O-antigen ligase
MRTAASPIILRPTSQASAAAAIFALIVFVVLAPLVTASGDAGTQTGEGNLLRQIVYFAIFLLALTCAGVNKMLERIRRLPFSIALVLIWCTLSILWALNPEVGARRLLLTIIIVLTIFLLTEEAEFERTVNAVRLALILLLIANYVSIVGWPHWSIHQAATEEDPSIVGAWRGILLQKNFAGAACAFTVIFFLFSAKRISAFLKIATIASAAYFLFKTESKTSEAMLISAVAVAYIFKIYNPYYRMYVAAYAALFAAALLIAGIVYWNQIAGQLLNGSAFTGRGQIWTVLLMFVRDHLLLGSGFGSFWDIGEPKPVAAYTDGWIAHIVSGHNGYLDLLVQIGLPGLVLAIFSTVVVPLFKLLGTFSLDRARGSLILACLWFGVGHNLTESSIFERDSTVHVFLMIAIALLGLEVRRSKNKFNPIA